MLFRNTLAQSGSVIAGYLYSFILGPIMLSRLGVAAFGLWAVTSATVYFVTLADLGIGRSLSRFIALHEAEGDERGLRESLTIGLAVATVVGALSVLLALVATAPLHRSLGLLDVHDMRTVLLCSAAYLWGQLYAGVLTAVPMGFRRMVPMSIAGFADYTANFVLSVAALLIHPTLVTYAVVNAVGGLVAIATNLCAMLYVWPAARLAVPSRARAREVFSFSLKNQVGRFADMVNFQTDKIVIGVLVDLRAAGAYEIAARVVAAIRAIAMLSVWAMIPTATAAIARDGRQTIGAFHRRYTPIVASLAFPIFVFTAATAPYLLMAWLDQLPAKATPIVVMLSIAYLVNMSTGVADGVTIADGKPGIVARYAALTAGLNIALTLALAPLFGLWGVLGGTFAAIIAGSLLFMAKFQRTYGLQGRVYLAAVLPSAAAALGLALPLIIWTASHGSPEDRWSALPVLAVMGVLYAITYWIVASKMGRLPAKLTFPWFGLRATGRASA